MGERQDGGAKYISIRSVWERKRGVYGTSSQVWRIVDRRVGDGKRGGERLEVVRKVVECFGNGLATRKGFISR